MFSLIIIKEFNMKNIVAIASQMHTREASVLLAIPIVNCEIAVEIESHMDKFMKHDKLSKGL